MMKTLREWLEVKVDTMANHYAGPRDKFKLTLQQHVKGRALIDLGKLWRCNQRSSDLKAAVNLQSARRKVSTQEDLKLVLGHLVKLSTETTSIVHALEVHASLINETLWETKAVVDAVVQAVLKAVPPAGWSLSPSIQNGDIWKVYTEAKVVVATGRMPLMGEHLLVIEEEEKARVTMEVDGTVKLRWHRYHLSFVSVTQRIVELEGRLAVHEADVEGRICNGETRHPSEMVILHLPIALALDRWKMRATVPTKRLEDKVL
ncbi:hypothetical protein OUZ56_029811 [Daphnia magna]|uniref:Uncharacterized protein n=1 Tax=Daphnia magna TaxID=35525 RepID=A0ABR0B7W6_9CRUS|nr:hypothetical protein OUZ56_029811 [Daphnia magna]